MVKYSYARLKGRIVEKYGSRETFAEHLGISAQSMSNKMTGKSGFSQKDITEWCKELEIPTSEIGAYFFK